MKPVGRVRIRNIMPIAKGYDRVSQPFFDLQSQQRGTRRAVPRVRSL